MSNLIKNNNMRLFKYSWIFLLLLILSCTEKQNQELALCEDENAYSPWENHLNQKISRRQSGYAKFDGPDKFFEFHTGIRTRADQDYPAYEANYRLKELALAKQNAFSAKSAKSNKARFDTGNGVISFTERGPSNTPGRTRALLVMPQDANHNTWLAGSSGGGIWKTSDRGKSWFNKSPNFPTLAVATLAMSPANPNIIYAGTGEYIASSGTAIIGDGIFKSTDAGETWTHLSSTASNADFVSVTRIIVDPANPDIVLACSAPNTWSNQFRTTIMRSTNGGNTWTKVYEDQNGGAIEQIIADPTNFNIQYAAKRGFGVLKSTNAGVTWQNSNAGMSPSSRVEIAIAPSNTSRLYASTVGSVTGAGADMYTSGNSGATWDVVNIKFNDNVFDFLGGQGWYDNTIAVDPFDDKVFYYGGVSLFKSVLGSPNASTSVQYTIIENNTSAFINFINFSANAANGRLSVGPNAGNIQVEVRFGPGKKQLAHRYLVPEGATSGVPDADYAYADYVEVPFEVWDVSNNRQLNVGFRDQDRNGVFNLLLQNTDGPATSQSREYVYISETTYSAANPHPSMATAGGHVYNNMYFYWPVLAPGGTWNPNNLPESKLEIGPIEITRVDAETEPIVDVYGQFNSRNRFVTISQDVHPDQHYLVMVPENVSTKTYFVILTTDGGAFYSNASTTPGVAQGSWNFAGNGYNTGQFYGADKRPGFDQYFGGMQDNGTWQSPNGEFASAATKYNFKIGGDGFNVIWNNDDDRKLIGGSQNNNFRRSIDGGQSWQAANGGLTGTSPFISKLSNSKANPNLIYTVTSAGVFRSFDFGESWQLTPITEKWGASTFLDVEVSRANANIVWAGSAMVNGSGAGTRSLHVSTNNGSNFNATNNYNEAILGIVTGIESHPTEPNTAYALFSFARSPKILRTTDLGQTWEDISGFYTNNSSSDRGFPDVAVYSLYVRPDNPDIIWAGTEIGIIESLDNGASWNLLEDFPAASVWQMKGQDNQIVIATHGRGIWTAEVDVAQVSAFVPEYLRHNTSPIQQLLVDYDVKDDFDSLRVLVDNATVGTIRNPQQGNLELTIGNISPGQKNIKLIGYKGNAPFHSKTTTVQLRALRPATETYFTDFTSPTASNDFFFSGKSVGLILGFPNRYLQTPHPHMTNREVTSVLEFPIVVSSTYPIIHYQDIAIIRVAAQTELQRDFVVVEASKDGRDWKQLIAPYDASKNSNWLNVLQSNGTPTSTMFVKHELDLSDHFEAGDKIMIRFRLSANSGGNAWGWAIKEMWVQMEPLAAEKKMISEILGVYPNPAADFINIKLESYKNQEVKLSLTDVFGRPVFKEQIRLDENGGAQIPVQNQRSGQYLLILEGINNERIVRKVMVRN
jgi:photosystem II stability/assembly factor-like uncharacterized protein